MKNQSGQSNWIPVSDRNPPVFNDGYVHSFICTVEHQNGKRFVRDVIWMNTYWAISGVVAWRDDIKPYNGL